jgi:hypothetical protein
MRWERHAMQIGVMYTKLYWEYHKERDQFGRPMIILK